MAQYRGLVSLVDGSYDPIHPGHLAYFRAARSLGYPVLCNICPDSETSKKHPVLLPAAERAQILDSLDILTYVHVSDRPTVEILRELQPAYYVKGTDWLDKLPTEQGQVCDELGIRIRYTDTVRGSSTALLQSLQPDLDAFETLVQSQREPDDWQPVTDYREEARMPLEVPQAARIAELMQPASVLDYGCGFGYLLHALREAAPNAKLYGYDPRQCDVTCNDITFLQNHNLLDGCGFDLVVSREVLEHVPLVRWRQMVTNLCDFSKRFVYVTTRYNEAPRHLLDIQVADDLDPTHVTMAPKELLRALFVLHGFKRRADLEQRMDHQNKGRVLVYERG